ncbi:MAG TPA: type II toxin-antitoxin system MqsA family antitoxin [bacterium]|nr:type II toxin-antitoxin system MqsA family antitoxin [bacterium]
MKCVFCGGQTKSQKVTFVDDEQGKYLAVENVPAQVCTRCGEKTYDPETTRLLLDYARNRRHPAKTFNMPVFDFEKPGDRP